MNYIGNIIKEYRCKQGMNRRELSENICSEKYVYLIEKGERSPSPEIIRLFSDKLGIDLFEYYQYLNCENPIAVREYINSFNRHHRKSEYIGLKRVLEEAQKLPDFQKKPWVFEIELNNLCYIVFVEKNYEKAINETHKVLSDIEPKYLNSMEIANFYVLLSTCYQLKGDLTNAKNVLSLAYKITNSKYRIGRYEQIITTVGISYITFYYLNGEYESVIREGTRLFEYQSECNSYERIQYTYFFLAFAKYKTGVKDEAIELFKRGIHSLMHDYKPMDTYYITMQDVFQELADSEMMDKQLIESFRKAYDVK